MSKIRFDGSMEGQTFSGDKYKGEFPMPKRGVETYSQFYKRVEACTKKGFHLGDLSWFDWDSYCKGYPGNEAYMQNDIIL